MDLDALEAIRQVKYRYFRYLDTKRFTELGELLTEDVTTSYQSGQLAHEGRPAVVAFLQTSLGSKDIISFHNGHHPEITLTGEATATGRWYLEDRVMVPSQDFDLVGTGLYQDEYVKIDGAWFISHTGYDRIWEEHRRHSDGHLLMFHSMFDAT